MPNCLQVKQMNLFINDHHILKDISFCLDVGTTLAIVGESGAGKSMIAQALIQCLPKNAEFGFDSSIKLADSELIGLSEHDMCQVRGKDIGLIFQDAMTALNPVKTIGKQLGEVLEIHFSLSRHQIKQEILSLLSDVGIRDPESCFKSFPHQLSGGMLQRAIIASVLAAKPKIIIADEPTTALDVTVQAKLVALLKTIQKKYNCSMIFISHDLLLVRDIADDIMVLQSGSCVEHNKAKNFFLQPESEYSKHLLAAAMLDAKMQAYKRSNTLLKTRALTVSFSGINVVDQASVVIKQGQTLALIGESGSGKTSLAKAILGIYPHLGKCLWHASISPKKDIAVVFQNPFSSMNPRMTIKDILTELWSSSSRPENWHDILTSALEDVGLHANCLDKHPHQFSGGQRQRICIARAIIGRPKLIILDEPTSALDVSIQAVISDLLIDLQVKYGYSYLLITHDFCVVRKMAHNVAVMRQGRILEQGDVATIFHEPNHDYTKELLDAANMV